MDRKDVNAWVWSAIVGLLPSQINTLADLVGAALALARLSLAEIGRRLLAAYWRPIDNFLSITAAQRPRLPSAVSEGG